MKMKIHAIAAAVALATVAATASAAITPPSSGNSSLVLFAWDTAGAGTQAYAFNTGLTLNDILATPSTQSFNVGGSSVFSSFFSSADIQSGSVQYMLMAGNDLAENAQLVTSGSHAPGWQSGNTVVGSVAIWLDQAATNLNGSGVYAQNANEYVLNDLVQGNGNLLQNLFNTFAPNDTPPFATVGSSVNLYSSTSVPNGGTPRQPVLNPPTVTTLDGLTFTLEANGQLDLVNNVSPVPEPDAFWLMGSGLAAVGMLLRRRRATAA